MHSDGDIMLLTTCMQEGKLFLPGNGKAIFVQHEGSMCTCAMPVVMSVNVGVSVVVGLPPPLYVVVAVMLCMLPLTIRLCQSQDLRLKWT
jgi:hypothetical protein